MAGEKKPFFFDVRGRSVQPFQFFIGGRGIGKTYSALDAVRDGSFKDADGSTFKIDKVMFLRRSETDITKAAESNPFKKLNSDKGDAIQCDFVKRLGFGHIWRDIEGERQEIGYTAALSTFAGVRGTDFSDVNLIIFDEFIPEKTARPIKAEGEATLHLIETINRNRELVGAPPVRVLFLANSITLKSPILFTLNLVQVVANMIGKGQHKYTDKARCLYIEVVDKDSIGVSGAKSETALYKLARNTDFEKQALGNEFTGDSLHLVKKVNISEYKPFLVFGGCTLYTHKSNGLWYAAMRVDTAPLHFQEYENEKFRMFFGARFRLILSGGILFFDNINTKMYLETALL